MRKFGFVAMAGLIAAALGGWLSTATTARVGSACERRRY